MLKTAESAFGENKTMTFRTSWLRLYATMAFWFIVLVLPTIVLPLLTGRMLRPIDFSALFVGLMGELFFAVLFSLCFPVRLHSEGLRGFNAWGVPCRVAWDEITTVTPSRALGLPWLIVRSRRRQNVLNALWVPLYFTDKSKFWEALTEFAPPSSPLLSGRP